ncbi:MAG TPA: protein kinase, partial [Kofleriaceae bacterium]|nr:protein kinase [Kofleriaceae bacterium]
MSERIGRYELVKTLAEGDRGKLYLARTGGFGGFARHVVIKTFEKVPGAAEGPFIEETLDLGRLHHQHITPILDVGRDRDRFFIALDFVHGRSAREVWQQAFTIGALLPLDFALTVVAAIASGLHHAHTRTRADGSPLRLVHGHVSLSNVIIGYDGAIQLLGFAGASARGLRASETQLGFSKDQLAYLAPEQARRTGVVDARSDVFALGVILYELTTMRRAFRDDSDRMTLER